jgi:hypothetical protein
MAGRTDSGIAKENQPDGSEPKDPAPPPLPPGRKASTAKSPAPAAPAAEPTPSRKELPAGISEDAADYADLVEQPENSMSLESAWLYKLNDQVFGPLRAKALLEKLYSGEVNAETAIAPEDGEFMALRRYGAFRAHLPKAKDHLEALAEVRQTEKAHRTSRRTKTIVFAVVALVLGSGAFFGIRYAIRSSLEEQAKQKAKEEEKKLLDELADLNAKVTIEPPLIDLPDETEPGQGGAKGRKKKRTVLSGAAAYNGPPGAELTAGEIIGGIQNAFTGLKACLAQQMRQDRDSVPERLVLSFNINNAGVVQNVDLDDRALRGSPLRSCMASKLTEVHFRKFNGEVRNVEFPITVGRR